MIFCSSYISHIPTLCPHSTFPRFHPICQVVSRLDFLLRPCVIDPLLQCLQVSHLSISIWGVLESVTTSASWDMAMDQYRIYGDSNRISWDRTNQQWDLIHGVYTSIYPQWWRHFHRENMMIMEFQWLFTKMHSHNKSRDVLVLGGRNPSHIEARPFGSSS